MLTAPRRQSWVYGKVIALLDPAALSLGASRGYETYYSKLLMRWSVVASDVLGGCAGLTEPDARSSALFLFLAVFIEMSNPQYVVANY